MELIDSFLEENSTGVSNTTVAYILFNKARAIERVKSGEEALKVIDEALKLDEISHLFSHTAHNYKSIVQMNSSNFSAAFESLERAYDYIEYLDAPNYYKHKHYNNLSVIYYRVDEIEKAISNQKLSIEFYEKTKPEYKELISTKQSLASIKTNLTSMYLNNNELEKAKANIDSTLTEVEKNKFYNLIVRNYTFYSAIYIKQDSLGLAEKYFDKASGYLDKIIDMNYLGIYYLEKGRFEMASKNYDEAYKSCKEGFDIFDRRSYLPRKKICADCLYEISQANNNPAEALEWYKISNTLNDSLKSTSNLNKISQIESENKFEQEIALLEEKAKREKNNKLFLFIVFCATLLFLLALIRIYFAEKQGVLYCSRKITFLKKISKRKILLPSKQ